MLKSKIDKCERPENMQFEAEDRGKMLYSISTGFLTS